MLCRPELLPSCCSMADRRFRKPLGKVGHQTTVDLTRKGTYETTSNLDRKRPLDEVQGIVHPNRPRTTLAELKNDQPKHDFVRPSVAGHPSSLKASVIHDAQPPGTQPSEYSQRRLFASTPTSTIDPLLSLSHPRYQLPKRLVENLFSLGVKDIYPWQRNCLEGDHGILKGIKNLVYVAPTGGGKSLIADVLMLKNIVENPDKKAILVLPYVALVQEKTRWLRRVVDGVVKNTSAQDDKKPSMWKKRGDEDTLRIAGLHGGSRSRSSWAELDIAVCTIEKANSLINAAIEDQSIDKLGVVVMDELHMLDDESRGYIMELMATKLMSLEHEIQIIGMSATLSNARILATWLNNARFYQTGYRPIQVREYLVYENNVHHAASATAFYKTASKLSSQTKTQKDIEAARIIDVSEHKEYASPVVNAVVALATETARMGYGALVFCSSRVGCERNAELISRAMPRLDELDPEILEKRNDVIRDLRALMTGMEHIIEKVMPYGVAFHHAGLTTEERDIIAKAFDAGVVKVLVATCSLAAGVNLPARRVILSGARMGRDIVGPSLLRQMRGRAGRKGKDEIGETYLCCQKSDIEAVAELMDADIPAVESCLSEDKRGIERALLEVIGTRMSRSREAVDLCVQKTLLYHSSDPETLRALVDTTIKKLVEKELITVSDSGEFDPTLLGQAIVASSLTPEDGIFVYRELRKALQAFVMDGDMHVLYNFTPVHMQNDVDWQIFQNEMEGLDESGLRAMTFVGIRPGMINKLAAGGALKQTTAEDQELARIHKRFYAAFQLRDLCNEMPIHAVARKYKTDRGIIQSLSQTCHSFAAGIIKFCERMGWSILVATLEHMVDRLKAGAKADLLALATVTYIKSRTARIFWDNGYKSVGAIAAADIKDLVPILLQAQPRKLRLGEEEEERKFQKKLMLKAEAISKSANAIWDRECQAEALEEEEE